MHPSIIEEGNRLKCTTVSPSVFGCPLCRTFTTKSESVIQRHLVNHVANAVHFKDKIICRCNLLCRDGGHFHCPFCGTTIIRKDSITTHLTECKNKCDAAHLRSIPPSQSPASETHPADVSSSMSVEHSFSLPASVSALKMDHSYTQTESQKTPAVAPAKPEEPDLSQSPPATTSEEPIAPEEQVTGDVPPTHVKCTHCPIVLFKRNLSLHIQRKHGKAKDTTAQSHLQSISVDQSDGLCAVTKTSRGEFSVPVRVQHKTWGQQHVTRREMEDCRQSHLLAQESGLSRSLCNHTRSLDYCNTTTSEEQLDHQVLQEKNTMKGFTFYGKRAGGIQTRVPPEESEDSCLSDSGDSDDEYTPKPGNESSSDESTENRSSDEDSGNDDALPGTSATAARGKSAAATTNRTKQRVAWETVQQQNSAKDIPVWQGALPDLGAISLPIDYFRTFFDADLLDCIVEQSNLYHTQQNPTRSLNLDKKEFEQFIGTLVYMSVFHLPRSRMYWSTECRVPQVADVMSRDRWEEIKHFIHFCDNMAPNNDDRLFKVRPLIDSLLSKFQALPQDQVLSIAEQMVPFKGRSSVKQCIPKKKYKWGYKIFVLCDTKGLVHSFDIYSGKSDPPPGQPDIGARGNVVLKLAQVIPGAVNHLLCFDNSFSSLDLFVALANKGVPALGTVRQSRLQGCTFSADANMKNKGRGTFEEQQAVVDGAEVRAVKWFEDGGVIVASTFASAQPVSTVDRWDRLKQRVSVECPSVISFYNKFSGGADALDAMIAYDRIHIRSKKYYHRLFFHFVDMVIVNSWLLYRRDCESLCVPRKLQKDLLAFRISIAQALCMQGKDLSERKRGRPSLHVESQFQKKKRPGPV